MSESHDYSKTMRPNKSLHPTPGSVCSSAARFTSLGPAWLSLWSLGRFTP